MSLPNKSGKKTGIPVIKSAQRSGESATASSSSQTSQSESVQNVGSQRQTQQSTRPTKPVKKVQVPVAWSDDMVESQSQKLRSTSISEAKRRREDMEKHLREAELQLSVMGSLLEQREKIMKEAAEEADKKTLELELKLLNQDGLLMKHNIDPVTGEQILLDEEGEKKVESSKKITKKKVQELREKLKQMNNQAETYLSEIGNTIQFLKNMETASEKLIQMSEGSLTQFSKVFDIIGNNKIFLTESEVPIALGAGAELLERDIDSEIKNDNELMMMMNNEISNNEIINNKLTVTKKSEIVSDDRNQSPDEGYHIPQEEGDVLNEV